MASRNEKRPPRSLSNKKGGAEEAFSGKRRRIGTERMERQGGRGRAPLGALKAAAAAEVSSVEECSAVEFTKEEMEALLNEKTNTKDNGYDNKKKMEQMRNLIKRLKLCVRWCKKVEEGYVQEKEKLQTDLEFAEKKCLDTENEMKIKIAELAESISNLKAIISSLEEKIAREESDKMDAIACYRKELEDRSAAQQMQASVSTELEKVREEKSAAERKAISNEDLYKRSQEYNMSLPQYNSPLQSDLETTNEAHERLEMEKATIFENPSNVRGHNKALQDQLASLRASQDEVAKQKEMLANELKYLGEELKQIRDDQDRQQVQVQASTAEVEKYKEYTGKSCAQLDSLTIKTNALEIVATFRFLLLWTLFLCFAFTVRAAQRGPYGMHISCGARHDVQTKPTTTVWYKDFGYTGGIPANASRTSYIAPPLKTLRYFPVSEGPSNCYNINRVPKGHYSIRIFFGLVEHARVPDEPLFDISIQGTQIYSLKSAWTSQDDQAFTEAQVFLMDGSVSICFHGTGHGDPAILSIEILQIDDKAYYFGPEWSKGVILRTVKRLSCGFGQSKFGVDYGADPRGGDRYWQHIKTFGEDSDRQRSVETRIKQASHPPNFYPETLYRSALVSTSSQPDLKYTLDVDPNKNYSVWLHFAEIDNSVTAVGQRVFDIMINGDVAFRNVDIVKLSGDRYTALVLNKTVTVNGRTLIIALSPIKGSFAIINAIEILEIITAESQTLSDEVMALQTLKKTLGLPPRFGWNGDPCVPQQHPWTGADCRLDKSSSKWVIDGLGLDNQGLKGFLPNDISRLHNLQILNLSGNSIRGTIPSPLGTITSLQVLDLSYNIFNGSIPESLGQLTSLQRLNLNGNSLSGRVPATLGGRLLHGASFNFTDNSGLCGIPGLPTCGTHLSAGAKVGIGLGVSFTFLLLITGSVCWWKRRQNILRVQQIAARAAPYAKARTQFSRDIQMARHNNNYGNAQTAAENGPILLSR